MARNTVGPNCSKRDAGMRRLRVDTAERLTQRRTRYLHKAVAKQFPLPGPSSKPELPAAEFGRREFTWPSLL